MVSDGGAPPWNTCVPHRDETPLAKLFPRRPTHACFNAPPTLAPPPLTSSTGRLRFLCISQSATTQASAVALIGRGKFHWELAALLSRRGSWKRRQITATRSRVWRESHRSLLAPTLNARRKHTHARVLGLATVKVSRPCLLVLFSSSLEAWVES